MTCYYPIHAYKGKSEEPNKVKIEFKRNESWRGERIELPCGQCIGCRLERARQWAVRCVHEASLYEKNCFLTLTYDKNNVPENGSVVLPHFQEFIKKLRRESEQKLRYFHCGEYGEGPGRRPHYHAIIFNYEPPDKKYWATRNGFRLYTSESVSNLWKKGYAVVGSVTKESAGYCARYTLKKVTGDKAEIHYEGRRPEYCSMSRRPGIGYGWFEKFYDSDVYQVDRIWTDGSLGKPPRYYDELLKKKDLERMVRIKKEREQLAGSKVCRDYFHGKLIIESDSCDRRLIEKEKSKLGQISLLNRHKEGV